MEKVSKSFDDVKALVDADFIANCGEVHALLGENGAGKSTLIKILSGAIKADSGNITLSGKHLFLRGPSDAIRLGIGTVYQELSLIPVLTVADNIFFGQDSITRFGRVSIHTLYDHAQELFERYGLLEDIDPKATVGELSLRQRQLVEIIKVIARNPQVLILDEATSALTEDDVNWLLKLARQFADKGKIVIYISHRMGEVKEVADRVTVFRNGSNVGVRSINETNSDELVSLMLGKQVSGYFPVKHATVQNKIALQTRQLCLGHALQGVNFELRWGEVLGVGGLAGQGEVPLFLSLFGIYRADGDIFIDGKLVKINKPSESLRYGIALVPEDRNTQGLISRLSIRENMSLPILKRLTRYLFVNRREERRLVVNVMKNLRIKADRPDILVMNLSGGNQQKVVIAKLLLTEPKILLMFDITRGVDVGTKVEIFNLVRGLAAKGNAILYYSTTIDELVNVCDSVVVMHDGRIEAELNGPTLTKENIIRASVGEKVK